MNKLSSKLVSKKSAGKGKQKPVPVKIVSDANTVGAYPSTGKRAIDKYDAQDALRALQRASEIRSNKALMKAAKAEAKTQLKMLTDVCK